VGVACESEKDLRNFSGKGKKGHHGTSVMFGFISNRIKEKRVEIYLGPRGGLCRVKKKRAYTVGREKNADHCQHLGRSATLGKRASRRKGKGKE